jgi:putative transposase
VASNLSKAGRIALLDWEVAELPLKTQAELLSLNRSGLYYRPVAPSAEEVAIKHRIDELYTRYPFYGSRRITAVLRSEWNIEINRKAVQRHMREMGIAGICPGPNLSQRHLAHRIYPYLLRHVTASYPNHVWGIDVTYVRLHGGWMFLVAVLDWFSRYVISWELDQTLELPFILSAVDRALAQARPLIWNSDQGSHFTSPQYLERLLAAQVQVSMDGKERAIDNIFTERLWRTVKYEDIYLRDYDSPRATRLGLSHYFAFYNDERPHQSLGYRTPAQVYFGKEERSCQTPPSPALASPILYPEGRQCTLTMAPCVS